MHVRRAAACAAAITLFAVAPAAAHTDLISTKPKDGATLSAPPQAVTLTFGEDLLTGGDKLVARDADGTAVDLGPSKVEGPTLSATWPASAAAGAYTVSYRAVAEDGHPLEGTVRFTIASPAQSPSPVAQVQPPAEPAEQSSSGVTLWAPLALIAALAVAGGLFWRSRAR